MEGCGIHADTLRHHCAQVESHHFVNWMRHKCCLTSQTTYKFCWLAPNPAIELRYKGKARISSKATFRTMASCMEVPALNDYTIITGGALG